MPPGRSEAGEGATAKTNTGLLQSIGQRRASENRHRQPGRRRSALMAEMKPIVTPLDQTQGWRDDSQRDVDRQVGAALSPRSLVRCDRVAQARARAMTP